MSWQPVGNPNDEMWDYTQSSTIEGTLEEKKSGVGVNKSMVYSLRTEDGKSVGVWGSTVLDGKFADVNIGDVIKVTYLGEKKGKGPKPYKVFTLDKWAEA